jgi:hypothetical protein
MTDYQPLDRVVAVKPYTIDPGGFTARGPRYGQVLVSDGKAAAVVWSDGSETGTQELVPLWALRRTMSINYRRVSVGIGHSGSSADVSSCGECGALVERDWRAERVHTYWHERQQPE